MRLISLEIKNFRVIKSARLFFPDKVIGIIGPNGAGKSSIIEAISWVLYGNQAARTGKDEIKAIYCPRDENCEVSLEFSINEEKYKVVRRLLGRNERAEVELYRGDTSESVGVNETKAYVGQLLGLDWRGFLSSFLARQQELNALSDLPPAKRRDHIAGMLGIEKLDKAIQKVKEDIRISFEKTQLLEKHLAEKGQVEKRVAELYNVVAKLEGPLNKVKDSYKQTQDMYKKITSKFEKMQRDRDKWLKLKFKTESEEQILDNNNEQLGGLEQEKEELTQAQARLSELHSQLEGMPEVKKKLDDLKTVKGQISLKEELSRQKTELLEEKKNVYQQISTADDRQAKLEKELKKIPDNIEEIYKKEQQNLEAARENYSRTKADKETLEKELVVIGNQLSSITELGPDSVCERCQRPFGDDYNRIQNHLNKELKQLKIDLEQKGSELEERKKVGEEIKARVTELEKQVKEHFQFKVSLKGVLKEQNQLQIQAGSCRAKIDKIEKQLKQLGEVKFDRKEFENIEERYEELFKKQQEYNQLKGSLTRLPVVNETIVELKLKNEKVRANITKNKKKLVDLNFKEEVYAQLSDDFSEAQYNLEEVKDEFQALSKEKELNEKELEGKLQQLKGFEKDEVELDEFRTAHYHGEKLSSLFSEFRKDLIASIRPSLAEISSRLFSEMTDGKYSLVDLDEKYNLRVMDNGIYFGIDRFSGGEKDLANLCLRMAISLALTESAGLNRSFVILDEVFGSQDNQRKELILRAMGKLKNRFPQILLITHIEDIKDGVEEIIEVLPTGNGWSRVVVNGTGI